MVDKAYGARIYACIAAIVFHTVDVDPSETCKTVNFQTDIPDDESLIVIEKHFEQHIGNIVAIETHIEAERREIVSDENQENVPIYRTGYDVSIFTFKHNGHLDYVKFNGTLQDMSSWKHRKQWFPNWGRERNRRGCDATVNYKVSPISIKNDIEDHKRKRTSIETHIETEQREIAPDEYQENVPIYSTGCNVSIFTFKHKRHLNYVSFNGTLPDMSSWTACLWVRPHGVEIPVNGTIISYCAPNSSRCNTLAVLLKNGKIRVNAHSKNSKSEGVASVRYRTHLCVLASSHEVRIYVNGSSKCNMTMDSNAMPEGGVLIVGQDQDGYVNGSIAGAPKNEDQGLHGEIEGLRLWNRSLEAREIKGLFKSDGCSCVNESVVTFHSGNSIIKGDVTTDWNFTCN